MLTIILSCGLAALVCTVWSAAFGIAGAAVLVLA